MKYNKLMKLGVLCAAITLTSMSAAVAQTTTPSAGTMNDTTAARYERQDDRPNFSWLGLLGLLGLAGLKKSRNVEQDRLAVTPRHA